LAHHLFVLYLLSDYMKPLERYPHCFVCGDENPAGLNIPFFLKDGKVVAEYTAEPKFQGYQDILHGGILSALLDEVMIRAVLARGISCLTIEINVRFKKMVKIGDKLSLEGSMTGEKGKLYLAEGRITNQDGEVVAEGTGKFIRADGETEKLLV
jgi:uncharacterized protein (TIGR00369 family)